MTRFRFSLAGLLGLVLLIAVSFAALRSGSDIWSCLLFTLMMCMLFLAILGIVYRQGEARAFWVGFALFGWGYFLFAFGTWLRAESREDLLGSKLAYYLHPMLQPSVPATGVPNPPPVMPLATAGPVSFAVGPSLGSVRLTCNTLSTLLVAFIGGILARYFYSTGTKPAERTGGPQP